MRLISARYTAYHTLRLMFSFHWDTLVLQTNCNVWAHCLSCGLQFNASHIVSNFIQGQHIQQNLQYTAFNSVYLLSVLSPPRWPHCAGPGQVPASTNGRDDHNCGGLGHVGRWAWRLCVCVCVDIQVRKEKKLRDVDVFFSANHDYRYQ